MTFPDDLLAGDERTLLTIRPHGSEVVPPTLFFFVVVAACGGGVGLLAPPGSEALGFLVLFFGLIAVGAALVFLMRLLHWLFTRYAVTDRRVILREGMLSRDNRDVPLSAIQDVRLRQGVVARIVGAGDLELQSAAVRGHTVLRWVPGVQQIRRTLHELVHTSRSEPVPPSGAAEPSPADAAGQTDGQPARADIVAQLQQLSELRAAGHLTEQEFEVAKQRLLGGH